MDLHELAAEGAAKQAQSEAEAFKKAMSRIIPAEFKVNDEIEQAFRHGMCCDDLRIEQIATHYGFTSQADMLCEESAEFMVALNKLRRGSPDAYDHIKEEVADVLIVARQLRYLLGYEDIDRIINEKLDRQMKRISEEG